MADWSRIEVEAAVADYLDMLALELRGEPFNKAEHNRDLARMLNGRTRGSIERKHQNISAVLIEIGYPYIDGYKPLRNYQQLLRDVGEERLLSTPALDKEIASLVVSAPAPASTFDDILSIRVPVPVPDRENRTSIYESPANSARALKRNYLEMEARNAALGFAGEQLVVRYEQERLSRAGQDRLASKIIHISATESDSSGFDILSYDTDGCERLIEVKTTRFGAVTPFFASRNEVELSDRRNANYQLYRLFKFSEQPKLFMLPGSLKRTCQLDPVSFSARLA
jgi:Protein NO VEIN, C-terminal